MPPIAKYDADQDPRRWFRMMLLIICKETREATGESKERVADLVGVSGNTIVRFEKGEHFPKMENVDRYIAGYAKAGGLKDPFVLLEQVAAYWRVNGRAPLTREDAKAYGASGDEPTPLEILRDISDTLSQASEEPTSTGRRRAGAG